MLDTMAGVRTLIDRSDLPPRLKLLIENIEKDLGPIDEVPDKGGAEVRQVLNLVDGTNLLAGIIAWMIETIPYDGPELNDTVNAPKSKHELWQHAVDHAKVDGLVLLEIGDSYYAFDEQARRIADATVSHMIVLHRADCVALFEAKRAEWIGKIVEAKLDVYLVTGNEDEGYDSTSVLDAYAETPVEDVTPSEGGPGPSTVDTDPPAPEVTPPPPVRSKKRTRNHPKGDHHGKEEASCCV